MSTQILQKEEACRAPPEKFWSKVRINERISKRWWESLLYHPRSLLILSADAV